MIASATSAQDLVADLSPFFELVKPEELRKQLQTLLTGLNIHGLITDCVKLGQSQYKITLDRDRDLTYHTQLGPIGTIEISKETVITLSPLEHGHPKSEPETVTDQRRITFNPPISVKLGFLYKGNVESLASDHYHSRHERGEQSRFEVKATEMHPMRISSEQIISHLKCLRWSHIK